MRRVSCKQGDGQMRPYTVLTRKAQARRHKYQKVSHVDTVTYYYSWDSKQIVWAVVLVVNSILTLLTEDTCCCVGLHWSKLVVM